MNTHEKVAVITGGASGIGAALADVVVARGGRSIIADYNGDAAWEKANSLGDSALAIQCDVANIDSVEDMANQSWDWSGGVDLVFANAGIGLSRPFLHATEEQFDATMGVNLKGVWATAKAFAVRMMADNRPGHICMTGSEHSLGLQHPGNAFYTASKHGVLAFGDVFRAELPDTIGVSVLCPGLTATRISDNSGAVFGQDNRSDEAKQMGRAVMAEGKSPAEVARHTLDQIENGARLIMTEPSAYIAAEQRAKDVKAAFDAQAPMTGDNPMRYHVETVVARLRGKTV